MTAPFVVRLAELADFSRRLGDALQAESSPRAVMVAGHDISMGCSPGHCYCALSRRQPPPPPAPPAAAAPALSNAVGAVVAYSDPFTRRPAASLERAMWSLVLANLALQLRGVTRG